MLRIKQSSTFRKWYAGLRDRVAVLAIASRIDRLAHGNAGDVDTAGHGISELRIHYGPGYRVYFQRRGDTLVLLLAGGTKTTQSDDIKLARRVADQWRDDPS